MRKTIFKGRNSKIPEALSTRDMIVFGFAFLAPMGSAFIYGQAVHAAKGSLALGYSFAGIVMILTMLSYRKIISEVPGKVSTLTGVSQTLHPLAGFAAGWSFMLVYIAMPVLAFVFCSKMLKAVIPSIPVLLWVILFAAIAASVNLLGTKTVARANLVFVSLGAACTCVYILVCLMAVSKGLGAGNALSVSPFVGTDAGFTSYITGIAFAAGSMFGIDAMTAVSSESESNKRNLRKALLIGGIAIAVVFFLTAYASGLAWPLLDNLAKTNTLMEIGTRAGGTPMKIIFCFGAISSVLAVGIAAQAAAAKSLETMGLEGFIPQGIFTGTPWRTGAPMLNHIILLIVTAVAACTLTSLSILGDLVRFGGMIGFILINGAVIYCFCYKNKDSDILASLVVPSIAGISCLSFFAGIEPIAMLAGVGWLVIGALTQLPGILALVKQPKKGRSSSFLAKSNSDLDSVKFDDSGLDSVKFNDSEPLPLPKRRPRVIAEPLRVDTFAADIAEPLQSVMEGFEDIGASDPLLPVIEEPKKRDARSKFVRRSKPEPVVQDEVAPVEFEDEYDEPVALNNEHLIDKLRQIVSEEEGYIKPEEGTSIAANARTKDAGMAWGAVEVDRPREPKSMVWAPVEASERKGGEIVWKNPEAEAKRPVKKDDDVMRWGSTEESDKDIDFPDGGPGYWRKL
jgi:amino acid transporter